MPMSKSSSLRARAAVATPATSSPLTFWIRLRLGLALVLVALPLGLLCASCLNPQDDYNAYVSRAADAQAPQCATCTSEEASTVDVAALRAPDASFNDTKVAMLCLSEQYDGDLSSLLLFVADVQYAPSGTGGGMVNFTSSSLPSGSTDVNSPVAGTQITGMAPIDAHGAGTVMIAMASIPQVANALTNDNLTLTQVTIALQMESPTQICCDLGGTITAPARANLNPVQNPCIFLSVNGAGQWTPPASVDQIHCP
jgi:hypothetical protein